MLLAWLFTHAHINLEYRLTSAAQCQTKNNECVYRPSRRGGPRVRKKPLNTSLPQEAAQVPLQQDAESLLFPDPSQNRTYCAFKIMLLSAGPDHGISFSTLSL